VWQWTRSVAEGFCFDWLTFDEGYGGVPAFLKVLDLGRQKYVGEVPVTYRVAAREGGKRIEAREYLKSTARKGWKRWVQKHESGGVSVWKYRACEVFAAIRSPWKIWPHSSNGRLLVISRLFRS
jgi:hypothetical protein